jgi:hypothetical protein
MLSLNYDSEDDINEETVDNFDTTWITEFEKVDKNYASFYKEDLYYVKITIIYVNKMNEIDKIKEENLIMRNKNTILKEEIIGILKRNNTKNNKKFSMMTLLKYNLDLEPLDVKDFLLNQQDECSYLSVIKNVDDIKWNRSISMFQDLNNLFIIFYEDNNIKNEMTDSKSKTKRVYFGSSTALSTHRKTLRKTT